MRWWLVLMLLLLLPFVAVAQSLDEPFGPQRDTLGLVAAIMELALFLIIIAAAIYIAIGAYAYFVAAGNAAMAQQGKEIIQRSIIGLILGLLAFIILQTISPQFTQLRQSGAPGSGGGNPAGFGPDLPEFPQPNPAITDPNVGELPFTRTRILAVDQTGPETFRFGHDSNPQPVSVDGVLQRVDALRRSGMLRSGDAVRINLPPTITPTFSLYQQLRSALTTRGLTLSVPGSRRPGTNSPF